MTNRLVLPSPTDEDLRELTDFRQDLHRYPELSGEERETARRVCEMLAPTRPDKVLTEVGGHGVAAIYDSGAPGPTILFRSELDALPIQELGEVEYRSTVPGKAHLCGHDGHSTILLGFARILSRARPTSGRVVLMFQPAEENGAGAVAVVADPRYPEIKPDWAFSLHNAPELEFGSAKLGVGPANCASRGIRIRLTGSTAHASRPADGRSPMLAISELMPALLACGSGKPLGPGFTMVTVTHASMGAESFGVAPGEAKIMATLRTVYDDDMEKLVAKVEGLIAETAKRHGLSFEFSYDDVFAASINDAEATTILSDGMERAGIKRVDQTVPSVGSEDFGQFGLSGAKAAMLFLGSGPDWPRVHTPEYDFRDELIPIGIRIFSETLAICMENS
ncbi:amidohydrolase [Aquamicrobium sp. LC103]|uniref:amidohydrolase n=1 Tax=Aquamicrobium sp. LC103 TaxID=1120658 RepID=UPI00063EA544|nr:amidohydrolase [Aquamicrobium sp. LC103]TKT78240.1 amidohydrolase [Aquamicrobium sp. LC103]